MFPECSWKIQTCSWKIQTPFDKFWTVLGRSQAGRALVLNPARSAACSHIRPLHARPLWHGRRPPENCVSRLLRHGRPRLCWKTVSHGPCVTAGPARGRKLFLKASSECCGWVVVLMSGTRSKSRASRRKRDSGSKSTILD